MMNEEYIKRLDFDSDTFEAMKTDMNFILQRMIGSMIEKDSTEGSMTIKIDVNMVTEWIPNISVLPQSKSMMKSPVRSTMKWSWI